MNKKMFCYQCEQTVGMYRLHRKCRCLWKKGRYSQIAG